MSRPSWKVSDSPIFRRHVLAAADLVDAVGAAGTVEDVGDGRPVGRCRLPEREARDRWGVHDLDLGARGRRGVERRHERSSMLGIGLRYEMLVEVTTKPQDSYSASARWSLSVSTPR